jgi:ABC-type polysaccharide/polyol phosphate export permease
MLTSFVLWVVFSYAFGNQLLDGQQYAPYLMAGIVLNNFFNQGVMMSAQSIAVNTGVLTKIYVPPQIFPISVALAGLVNFFIGLIPLVVVVYISGQTLAWTFPLVFVIGLCLVLLVSGVGLMLSLIFIRFDDTKNIVSVLLLIFTYVTPIFYPISILSPKLQQIVQLNPLTSYLDCFRWAFSNNAQASLFDWIYMSTSSLLAILIGRFVFKRLWPRTVAML